MLKIFLAMALLAAWTPALPAPPSVTEMTGHAEKLREQGFNDQAAAELGAALKLAQGDAALTALVMNDMGSLFQLSGMLRESRQYLDSSIALARKAKRPDLEAAALNNMGNLDVVEGNQGDALKHYESSAQLAAQTKNPVLEVQALVNAARASEAPERIASLLSDACKATQSLPQGHDKAYDLIAIGQLYGATNREASYRAFDEALKISRETGDRKAEAYSLGFLGQLYENAKRNTEALDLTRRAIFIAEQIDAPEILYRLYWQKGRLLKARNKQDEAIAAYRRAVDALQSIKSDLSQRYSTGQSSFRKVFSPLFFELADLLLDRAATSNGADASHYLVEARDTVEKSKTAELQDYFKDDCVTELQSKIVRMNNVEPHTAVIYPILLQDRMELLVTLPDGIRQFRVPAGAGEITEEIRTFRTLLEKRATRQYLPHAQKLHAWLIHPFESELAAQQVDTLVFVPDGPLRTIPMSALHDGKKFLIERYAIATTPGLTLTDPRPLQKKQMNVLLGGLTESVQGFSALPNVGSELKSIEATYQNSTVLKNETYVLKNMKEKMSRESYSVVHIASHGQFKEDSDKTFLLTHDEKLTLNQLQKLIAPTRYSDQPIELLTLSACQTAAGDDRAALGLAGIAIKAGARSALASLWFINDSSSSKLISGFYEHLKEPGTTKARALQEAQIDLINDSRFRHPGYWAPFLLIGNWL
ncbi:MAG: CHAT domain-containing protein [Burkholderiales bacterium]|nr:CHAT domain-containing protein [Burkholderiales bacterium]